jgi:hypothetical protein
MTDPEEPLFRALVDECRRRLYTDSLPRIEKCLGLLTPEQVWWRPNGNTVSIGNLVLHLMGNVHQNLVHALGGAPNRRDRAREFSEPGPIPTAELWGRLAGTMEEARASLDRLTPAALLRAYRVQGFTESGMSILVHTVEHFSYHVGQITYAVKARLDVDTGYYAGVDLNVR